MLMTITGSGFGNVSTYASNFHYRAWGALKHLTYSSYGRTFDATYNARLEAASFVASGLMSLTYQHNDDGTLRYSHDLIDQRFDRSYSYDHAGRLTQALSGPAARGETDNNNRPFTQDSSFDAWNNMTGRTGKHWSHNSNFSGSYVNNRMDGWQYDADGRNTVSNTVTSTYDAAGRLIQTAGPQRRNNPPLTLVQGFDGDGQRLKKVAYGETYYSLRSTVLGGAEITEIYGTSNQFFGQKQKGHVYVNGSELAEQNPFLNEAIYKAVDPSGTERIGDLATQLDPLGDDVGDSDPYLPDNGGDGSPSLPYPIFGDPADLAHGCTIDGAPVNCTFAFEYKRSGGRGELLADGPLGMAMYLNNREMLSPAAASLGTQPVLGRSCVTAMGGGMVVTKCTTEVTGYTNDTYLGSEVVTRRLEPLVPQNPDIIALNNKVHANYDGCKSILTSSPANKLKKDLKLHSVDEATAMSVLDTSALERVDATLIAVTWAAESSFSLNPGNHMRRNRPADVSPVRNDPLSKIQCPCVRSHSRKALTPFSKSADLL